MSPVHVLLAAGQLREDGRQQIVGTEPLQCRRDLLAELAEPLSTSSARVTFQRQRDLKDGHVTAGLLQQAADVAAS